MAKSTVVGGLSLLALVLTVGCGGGANFGEQMPGNPSGGVVLSTGSVAMHREGRWVVTRHKDSLMVMDMQTGDQRKVRGVQAPERLAFAPETMGNLVFVVAQPPAGTETSRELLSVSLESGTVVWRQAVTAPVLGLDVADVLQNVMVSGRRGVEIRRMATGARVGSVTTATTLHDLDVTADGQRLIVTENTVTGGGAVTTRVAVHSAADASLLCNVTVPNCASELVVADDGVRAFLAPTTCGRDPVSIINLDPAATEGCAFRENLPGFGPVLLTGEDHNTVVAFMDRTANDPTAPLMPDEVRNSAIRYHLMFINAETLEYDTVPFGDRLPRYAANPAGTHLLLDTVEGDDPMLTVLALDGRVQTRVTPTQVHLNKFAFATAADRAFVVDGALVRLDVAAAHTQVLPLDFIPKSLNVTPDGTSLVLTRADDASIYVYSVENARVARTFDPELVAAN
jgi:hypothetical protein